MTVPERLGAVATDWAVVTEMVKMVGAMREVGTALVHAVQAAVVVRVVRQAET